MTDAEKRLFQMFCEAEKKFFAYLTEKEKQMNKAKTNTEFQQINDSINGRFEFFAKELIANGVIAPPCKVGDTVYIKNRPLKISFLHIEGNNISFVIQFDCDDCGDCPFYEDDVSREGEHDCRTMGYIEFTEEDIGKTVFLTKEDTEKALKGEVQQ